MASPSEHRSVELVLLTVFVALIIWAILSTL
jgi:nitrate reductase NapE component